MQEDKSDTTAPHHIFDTVFKRLMQLSSPAIIQLINGLFGKQYPLDSTVTLLNTEYMTPTFHQWRSDIVILINQTDTYVIEAQLKNDEEMALRIFCYSYFEGSKTKIIKRTRIRVTMAPVMVIYFKPTKTTPDELELEITAHDNTVHIFRFPTFKFLDYTIGELAERNLNMLLPFYLLKLRRRVRAAARSKMETAHTTVAALEMARNNRTPGDDLLFHADRGVPYCAQVFREKRLACCPSVRQSMSRKGNCGDNPCAETFFKTLKRALETLEGKHSANAVGQSVFMYIEAYYNRLRMHSALDYLAPTVFNSGYSA